MPVNCYSSTRMNVRRCSLVISRTFVDKYGFIHAQHMIPKRQLIKTSLTLVLCVACLFTCFQLLPRKCDYQTSDSAIYDNTEKPTLFGSKLTRYLAIAILRETNYAGVDLYTSYTVANLNLKPLNAEPIRLDFGPVINDVRTFNYDLEVDRCDEKRSSLFIAIISAPANFERRKAVRETWLQSVNKSLLSYAFVMGLSEDPMENNLIKEESNRFHDVLQVSMLDNYYKLTEKAASLFNWLEKTCLEAGYLLKIDDDVYLNWFNLIKLMDVIDNDGLSMFGSASFPLPDRRGKWAISYEKWPWRNYPNYFKGGNVLINGRAIRPLLAAFQSIPFMPFDDVYLSGMASEKAGVELYSSERFLEEEVNSIQEDPCIIIKSIGWHLRDLALMQNVHNAVTSVYNGIANCTEHALRTQVNLNSFNDWDFKLLKHFS